MAHGSLASVCAGCVSVVLALAAAVHALDLDGARHDLDSEHPLNLLCLALAGGGASVGASRLGSGVGIWIGGSGRRHRRISAI